MTLPDDIQFIQRGWLNSNHILIGPKDSPILIDTGHILCLAETLQILQQHGYDPTKIQLIVNTHCHWDHLGANHAIRELSGALTATGVDTAVILRHHDREAMWLDYFDVDTPAVAVDITWQAGDVVQLGNYDFEVIATPGHAPDSIALYQPDTQLLISADALHEGDCGILNTAVHGPQVLDEAIETVNRLRQYEISWALPGHGQMITDVPASLEKLANRLRHFKIQPEKMARHLLKRVIMTDILLSQPIKREEFITYALTRPWLHDYAAMAGYKNPHTLLNDLLNTFIRRELIIEHDEALISLVPR